MDDIIYRLMCFRGDIASLQFFSFVILCDMDERLNENQRNGKCVTKHIEKMRSE